SDPLPHALILTAIVITFAVTAFLLAMIYRSWRLMRADSLQDDDTDLQVAITKVIDSEAEASTDYDDTEFGDEAESPIIGDRKSTRLNSSHVSISYAVFCLKKKKKREHKQ